MNPESKLAALGLKLPPVSQPAGLYKLLLIVDNIARVYEYDPLKADGAMIAGEIGAELSLEFRKAAARQAVLWQFSPPLEAGLAVWIEFGECFTCWEWSMRPRTSPSIPK